MKPKGERPAEDDRRDAQKPLIQDTMTKVILRRRASVLREQDAQCKGGKRWEAAIDDGEQPSAQERAVAMGRYCKTLWGEQEGFAYLAVAENGTFNKKGKYELPSRDFNRLFFSWPQDRKRLIRISIDVSDEHDVFFSPMLRWTESAKRGSGLGGKHLWADLDKALNVEQQKLLALLQRAGSFIVRSGRGRHVYVGLDRIHPAEVIAQYNHRLALAMDADCKWAENTILRPPGTFNHKTRAAGGTSVLVWWE